MSFSVKDIVNEVLPEKILPRIQNEEEQSKNYIKNFLMKTLPSSDTKNLNTELKWNFLLDKHSLNKTKTPKKKKTFLTRNQKRELDLLKLPKSNWNYKNLETLRLMWQNYMRQNLNTLKAPKYNHQDWVSFSNVVAKSELVGSEITVIQSRIPNQVGIRGTVVLETKMTFQIVTPKSQLKIIIKDTAVFEIRLDNMKFTVYGKFISTRPNERSVKKIKGAMVPDL